MRKLNWFLTLFVMFSLILTSCDLNPEDVESARSLLATAIEEAKTLRDSKTVGEDEGEVTQAVYDTYNEAISAAITVHNEEESTADDLNEAKTTLATATLTFTESINGTVEDTTPPVITLTGDSVIELIVNFDTYTDPGVTATDSRDGDLTSEIIVGGDNVDVNIIGQYVITYDVSDSSGNSATQVTRTVNVVADSTAPVITLSGSSVLRLEINNSTYTEYGAAATDYVDGDLTDSIVITGSVDTTNYGDYTITYTVSDSSGNEAIATRLVVVADPIDNFLSNGDFFANNGTDWETAGDAASFDYSTGAAVVTISSTQVNPWDIQFYQMASIEAGAYEFSFDYSSTIDSTLRVSIEDPSYTSYLSTGTENKPEVTAGNTVQTFSNTFVLTETVTEAKVLIMMGHAETGAVITLDNMTLRAVEDSEIAAVLTLLGDAPMTIEQGTTYAEPGATAMDNLDGDISGDIVITGSVDSSTIGSYTITYSVTDSNGNQTVTTRVVEVIQALDNPAPTTAPTSSDLENALVVYTDTALPASATQIEITSWNVLEGAENSSKVEVNDGSENMWRFTLSGAMRRELTFAPVDLTGKRVHFNLYAYGNSAEPAGPDGVTPNEFKVELWDGEAGRNTYQETATDEGVWITIDLPVSDLDFASATADLTAIESITINMYPSNATADESGFYIDNLYFY